MLVCQSFTSYLVEWVGEKQRSSAHLPFSANVNSDVVIMIKPFKGHLRNRVIGCFAEIMKGHEYILNVQRKLLILYKWGCVAWEQIYCGS